MQVGTLLHTPFGWALRGVSFSGSCSSKLEKQCLRPISETPLVYFFELRYPDGRLFKRPKEMLASAEKNAARAKFRIMAGVTRDGWAAFGE